MRIVLAHQFLHPFPNAAVIWHTHIAQVSEEWIPVEGCFEAAAFGAERAGAGLAWVEGGVAVPACEGPGACLDVYVSLLVLLQQMGTIKDKVMSLFTN